MRTMHRGKSAVSAPATVLLALAVAVLLPASSPLYAAVYPTRGTNVEPKADYTKALTEAALKTDFDHQPLVEYEESIFSATIIYAATPPNDLPKIQIAFSNEATLRADDGNQFTITPLTDRRLNLDEGTQRPGGGYQLTWRWKVVPRSTGTLTLILEIQPFVFVEGKPVADLEHRNKPVPIQVDVNKTSAAFDDAVASKAYLTPTMPPNITVDTEAEITASLAHPLSNGLKAEVVLERGQASVPITIAPPALSNTTVPNWKWKVTAASEGVVELVFNVRLTGKAGEQVLDKTVSLTKSVRAEPKPDPWWKVLQQPVIYLMPFLLFAGALVALRQNLNNKKKKKKEKPPVQTADPPDLEA